MFFCQLFLLAIIIIIEGGRVMKYNDYPDAGSNHSFDILSKVYASSAQSKQNRKEKQPIHSYDFSAKSASSSVPFAKRSTHSYDYGTVKVKSLCSSKTKEKIEDVVISYKKVKPLILKSNRKFPFVQVESKLSRILEVLPLKDAACLNYQARPVTMFRYEQELSNLVKSLMDLIGAILEDLSGGNLDLSKEQIILLLTDLHTILTTIFEKLSV